MPVHKKKSEEGESVRTSSGGRKVSVVLPPELAERVERLADVRGERLTQVVVRLIEAGERQAHDAIREDAVSALRTELLAEVSRLGEQTRKEVQGQAHRLSHLLARTALESIAARTTAGSALFALHEDDKDARRLYESAWKSAVESLKNPSAGVRQTLNEVAAASGELEPGVLAELSAATRRLQGEVGGIAALTQQVQAVEAAQTAGTEAVKEAVESVKDLIAYMRKRMNDLEKSVKALDDEVKRPKGIFGR